MKRATRQVNNLTTAYAEQVAAGSIVVGPYVRDQCNRHLADLSGGGARGLRFDVEAAERAISFFPAVLRLNGGEHEGKPFHLLPWQAFIVGSLFGWKNADGYRRFRMAFVLTGKGSGKSPLAGGIGIYMLLADSEPRAEVYAAASKREQAMILFRDAVAMVRQSPQLSERCQFSGGAGREYNIAHLQSGSFFRAIASEEGQSGPRPHCALLDEIHEHHDAGMVDMLRAGTKGRRQALILGITNAEASKVSVCAEYRTYAGKVCRGDIVDDAFFAYVAALDEGDDPFKSEDCWVKANPSMGQTFQPSYLRELVTKARGMPSSEAVTRRINFCEPTDAESPWIDRDLWEAAETDELDLAALGGLPCALGLDLSSKRDLTSLAAAWEHPDGTVSAAVWFWTPGETLAERARTDNVPYATWEAAGDLFAPEGRSIDKRVQARFVAGLLAAGHDVKALAFDQALIEDFLQACDDLGLPAWIDDARGERPNGLRMVRHGQGFAGYQSEHNLWMPRSVNTLEELIIAGRFRVKANPVLRWNSASAVLEADATGNRRWTKRKSTGRIDGMVALSMAVGALLDRAKAPVVSMWDDPAVWSVVAPVVGIDPVEPERRPTSGSVWDMPNPPGR